MQSRGTHNQTTGSPSWQSSRSTTNWGIRNKSTDSRFTSKSGQKQHTRERLNDCSTSSAVVQQASQTLTQAATTSTTNIEQNFPRVKRTINKKGGILEIQGTGVSLEIFDGALEKEEHIEMKIIPPILESESPKFASNSSLAIEILPSQVILLKPAILTVPHCSVLGKGYEWKATIYTSHHKEGSTPQWEEQVSAHYKLDEHNCVIETQDFGWKKLVIDDNIVEAKKIIVYAAERCGTTDSMILDIGFYLDLALYKEVTKRNNANLLHEQPTVFKKDGKSLDILLEKFEPMNWTYSKGKNPQAICFEDVICSEWSFCTFVLDKTERKGTDVCTCFYKAGQAPNLRDFIFQLKPSTSERQEAVRAGTSTAAITPLSNRAVTLATIEDLSHKLVTVWETVGRKLGIENEKLEGIDTDYRTAQKKAYQMLLTWQRSKGNKATYRILGEALQSAGRKDLQEKLYQQDRRLNQHQDI